MPAAYLCPIHPTQQEAEPHLTETRGEPRQWPDPSLRLSGSPVAVFPSTNRRCWRSQHPSRAGGARSGSAPKCLPSQKTEVWGWGEDSQRSIAREGWKCLSRWVLQPGRGSLLQTLCESRAHTEGTSDTCVHRGGVSRAVLQSAQGAGLRGEAPRRFPGGRWVGLVWGDCWPS